MKMHHRNHGGGPRSPTAAGCCRSDSLASPLVECVYVVPASPTLRRSYVNRRFWLNRRISRMAEDSGSSLYSIDWPLIHGCSSASAAE